MKLHPIHWILPALALLVFFGARSFAQSSPSIIMVSRSSPLPSELSAKLSLDDEMLESGQTINPKNLLWANRDLNGDGDPEVFVALVDGAFAAGGSNGFEHRIYTNIEGEAYRILAVNGNEFATDCAKRSEGFCDLIIDGTARMRYASGAYLAVRQ